ncbi:YkgJ family cysteine cluster protein [Scleromatobacter humisilvae]|uniref:YkgJ family cysteine cluster protein n=1 Tax=Scleromatobacter humisilvae TaxID=2897159 RepID=A0A9X1YPL4_9BURK|nr:YkgJ family cysteine cluster protein [Scleromatobacter humisilvae]MCK9688900.1 YkgJ family cysteine cluster protein [Scleromatobacter humisilvae]
MPPIVLAPSSATKGPDDACRPRCGACCIAPSITSPIPGMPQGKPAGVPCVQLDEEMRCRIFGRPERPAFCGGLLPSREMCGDDAAQAIHWLADLEAATRPA